MCESIIWDADVQKLLKDSLNNVRKALASRTRELEKGKLLARGLDADSAADLLMTLYSGLNVQARSGKSSKQLGELATQTLGLIKR